MPKGDKSAYTDKQQRKAEHIEKGYEARGVSGTEAERRAEASVNKDTLARKAAATRKRQEHRDMNIMPEDDAVMGVPKPPPDDPTQPPMPNPRPDTPPDGPGQPPPEVPPNGPAEPPPLPEPMRM